jgi:hypothetical protein
MNRIGCGPSGDYRVGSIIRQIRQSPKAPNLIRLHMNINKDFFIFIFYKKYVKA